MQISNLVKKYASQHNFTVDYATTPQEFIIVRDKHFDELYNYMKTICKNITVINKFNGDLKYLFF